MKRTKTLHSVQDVIDALGGRRAAKAYFGVSNPTLTHMLTRGYISKGYQLETYLLLREMGYRVSLRGVFNVDMDDTRARLDNAKEQGHTRAA